MNSIRDCARSLAIANNSGAPDTQLLIQAAEIILEDPGFQNLQAKKVGLVVDQTQKGAGGLDTGSPSPNAWYYIWVIACQTGQTSAVLSLSSDSPTMPPAFTFKAFVGAIQTDTSGKFFRFNQVGPVVARNAMAVLQEGAATVLTPVDCSTALPKKATKAYGSVGLSANIQQADPGYGDAWLASKPNQGMIEFRGYLQTGKFWFSAPFCIPVVESQTLYYEAAPGTNVGGVSVSISAFEF